ncbi:hypothetical protein OS493_040444, partial [Desmophyllum pertusum]
VHLWAHLSWIGSLGLKLGMILQMSATMFGTTGGPMLGMFSLGILTTRANTKGVWIGVLAGFWTVTWISIGALVNPPQYPTQPMSIAECPSNMTNFNMSSIQPAESVSSSFLCTPFRSFEKHDDERIDPQLLFDYSSIFRKSSLNGVNSTE